VTLGSTYGLTPGTPITGTGIPVGATISSVDGDGTTLTISAPATATGTVSATYGTGVSGALTVVKSGGSSLTLTPANFQVATSTAGTVNLTAMNNTTGLIAGQAIFGNPNIPAGYTIASIVSGTAVNLNNGVNVTAGNHDWHHLRPRSSHGNLGGWFQRHHRRQHQRPYRGFRHQRCRSLHPLGGRGA